jgi:predicted transcriptional regulator
MEVAMGRAKAEAIQLIQSLPDDCSWDDIRYRLYVRDAVERGLADVAAGRVVSQDEAQRQIEEWLQSSGRVTP